MRRTFGGHSGTILSDAGVDLICLHAQSTRDVGGTGGVPIGSGLLSFVNGNIGNTSTGAIGTRGGIL